MGFARDSSGGIVIISSAHFAVHRGALFGLTDLVPDLDTASQDYLIKTPDSESIELHFQFSVESTGRCNVFIFEDTTVSADGVLMTPYCKNRIKDTPPVGEFYKGPTVTDDGTQLFGRGAGSATVFPGSVRQDVEWIFKRNTNYMVRVTSLANDVAFSIEMEYYEV